MASTAVQKVMATIPSTRRIQKKTHICSVCDKVFKRSEHCIRHERAHRQERPFGCRYCDKKYARKDLVKRHEQTLHATQYEPLRQSKVASLNHDHEDGEMIPSRTAPNHSHNEIQVIHNGHHTSDAAAEAGAQSSSVEYINIQSSKDLGTPSQQTLDTFHDRLSTDLQSTTLDFMDIFADPNEHSLDIGSNNPQLRSRMLNRDMVDLSQVYELLSDNSFDASTDILLPHSTPLERSPQINHGPLHIERSPLLQSSSIFCFDRPIEECGLDRQTFEQLPRVLQESSAKPPRLTFTEDAYHILCKDVIDRLGYDVGLEQFATSEQVQRFLTSYVDCFHRHLPFLHLPSFSMIKTPSPLILSVCSIGALYRLDRRRARSLYDLADRLVLATQKSPDQRSDEDLLWVIQSRALLTFYAFFSGDASIFSTAFERVGHFAIAYRQNRSNLANQNNIGPSSWADWINRESRKRLLCAVYIINNLVVVTFEVTPGLVNNSDLEFEAPEEEMLWNATTEEIWEDLWRGGKSSHHKTVRDIMADVVSEHQQKGMTVTEPYKVPAFTMLVIMHAVCVHMWLSFQFSQMLSSSTLIDFPGPRELRIGLLATTASTLARCERAIEREGEEEQEISWDDPDGPLLFNCQALLRIAYTRQFTIVNAFNRPTLFNDDPSNVLASVSAYASARQVRSQFLTHAAAKACEGFLRPIRMGSLLVRKTAALNWSIEHVIAGWDSALFLTKWIHTVECDEEQMAPTDGEERIVIQLKVHLGEMESDYDGVGSLAAAVAEAWSMFLNDVWVWGIAPRMAFILEQLAGAYQRRFDEIRSSRESHV